MADKLDKWYLHANRVLQRGSLFQDRPEEDSNKVLNHFSVVFHVLVLKDFTEIFHKHFKCPDISRF